MPKHRELVVGRIFGRQAADLVRCCMSNALHLNVSVMPVEYRDTEATYLITAVPRNSEGRLNKEVAARARAYFCGIRDVLQAMSVTATIASESEEMRGVIRNV